MIRSFEFLFKLDNSFAVEVKIKRQLLENSTVPSSTKKNFSKSPFTLIIPGLRKVIKEI